ncbi:DDE-type integrase/transposase/recombinase [Vreelandella profundi]|uniref:DDE-type integrase/transposase/recombinase n=1 Tax=Vreelandella profundi TaxID=2852117 RepID=UPI001EF08079|nr:DDE-type integrase/transposase/recombinase [Halomonas profundi]
MSDHTYKKTGDEHVETSNHLERQFNVVVPNPVWCSDVTYIWTGNRWAYLAVVIGLFARKPIGWTMSLPPDNELTSSALKMANESRVQPKGVCGTATSKKRQTLWKYKIKTKS